MSKDFPDSLEARLLRMAEDFPYPPTPDIAGSVRRRLPAARPAPVQPRPDKGRRLAWGAAVLLVVLAVLLLVPPVRASILEFLQIGVVRIFLNEGPVVTLAPETLASETLAPVPTTTAPAPTATRSEPTPADLVSLLDMSGETDLEEARRLVRFPVGLPTYPASLGPPDRVFLQKIGDDMLVLVWLEPGRTDRVRLSLHLIESDSIALLKWQPQTVEETEVNGRRAVWTTGLYPLVVRGEEVEYRRLVDGHVLIWEQGEITYRLETDLPLEEAVRIAESIPEEVRDR